MDARVGAAGTGELDGVAEVAFQGGGQYTAYGVDARLDGETVESGPEVGDTEADPNGRALDDGGRGVGRRLRLVAEEGQLFG